MIVGTEPKVDCHNHVFDPVRFPYAAETPYEPAGEEIGTAAQLLAVFDTYGVRNSLVVGPNSGYATNSGRLLEDLASLGMFLDLQYESDQLLDVLPLVESFSGKVLVDHCGRPDPTAGVEQPGFQALLQLALSASTNGTANTVARKVLPL